jgi:hypothetical protein
VHRCCTWKYGELEEQIEQGFWIPVDVPPDQIFELTSKEQAPRVRMDDESLEPPRDLTPPKPLPISEDETRVNTWKWIMRTVSEICKDIYKLPGWVDAHNIEPTDL